MNESAPTRIATHDLLSFLALVLGWELEVAVALLSLFTPARLDTASHAMLIGLAVALTVLWRRTGQRRLREFRAAGGSAKLTIGQILLVCLFIITMGSVAGVVAFRIVNA